MKLRVSFIKRKVRGVQFSKREVSVVSNAVAPVANVASPVTAPASAAPNAETQKALVTTDAKYITSPDRWGGFTLIFWNANHLYKWVNHFKRHCISTMKIMNGKLRATSMVRVVEVLVKNGQMVDFGPNYLPP